MESPTTGTPRTIIAQGWSRARYALVLGLSATALALFVLWSLTIGHGIYAFIVLGVAVVALTVFGGPERRARAVTVSDEEIRIERFHRITTVVHRADLASVNAESRQDRGGRTRAELVLTPRDPIAFFSRHRELRIVRDRDAARIPVGTGARTVADLNEALSRRAA